MFICHICDESFGSHLFVLIVGQAAPGAYSAAKHLSPDSRLLLYMYGVANINPDGTVLILIVSSGVLLLEKNVKSLENSVETNGYHDYFDDGHVVIRAFV